MEKILEPKAGVTYPVCLKAKNDTPMEDSRWEVVADPSILVNPDAVGIMEDINGYFETDLM